jgi:hypothetical protein
MPNKRYSEFKEDEGKEKEVFIKGEEPTKKEPKVTDTENPAKTAKHLPKVKGHTIE